MTKHNVRINHHPVDSCQQKCATWNDLTMTLNLEDIKWDWGEPIQNNDLDKVLGCISFRSVVIHEMDLSLMVSPSSFLASEVLTTVDCFCLSGNHRVVVYVGRWTLDTSYLQNRSFCCVFSVFCCCSAWKWNDNQITTIWLMWILAGRDKGS